MYGTWSAAFVQPDPPSELPAPQEHAGQGPTRRMAPTHPSPRRPASRRPFRRLTPVGQWQARTHAWRPAPGHFVVPQLADLRLPAECRPVVDADAALAMQDEVPAVCGVLREDSRVTRRAVWAALVEHLHPETGIIVASQVRIAERASVHAGRRVGRSTAGNHMRALVDGGVLYVALPGASKEALGSDRGRAGCYVILRRTAAQETLSPQEQAVADQLAAAVDRVGHLPSRYSDDLDVNRNHSRSTGNFPSSEPLSPASGGSVTSAKSVLGRSRAGVRDHRRDQPGEFVPRTRSDREIAVAWLIAVMGWTHKPGTEQEVRKITYPWFAAGWTPASVLHAWHHQPCGQPWPGPLPLPHQRDRRDRLRLRNVWAVLTWRLSQWRDALGQPMAAPRPEQQQRRGRPRSADVPTALRPAGTKPTRRSAEVEQHLALIRSQAAQRAAATAATLENRRALLASIAVPTSPVDEQPDPPHTIDQAAIRRARAILRARLDRSGGRKPRSS